MSENSPTAVLSATDLTVKYGVHVVLENATIAINEGERVGLVGRNGSGKSTFLRIAAGALEPDNGQCVCRRDLVTGYLPQVFDLVDTGTVHENILAGARQVLELIRKYEAAPAESDESVRLLDRIQHADGWNIEHRIRSLISHLNAPDADRVVGTLSGGEKRRVALCRALVAQPDLLILDEPTNHLDTESIEWLEDFLLHYPGACLFVTHDRYFLDRVANRIIELADGDFHSHQGNYTAFLEAKATRIAIGEQQERGRQKFLKRELEWIRKGPRARRTKSQDRIARFYDIAAQKGPEAELDVELVIPLPPRLSDRVISLTGVGIELGGKKLFEDINFNFEAGMRLGIIGRNGLGKTTLLKIILGELQPETGLVEHGKRTKINYIDQNRLMLDDDKAVWEEVGEGSEYVQLGTESITLRNYLGRFLFSGERINTKVGQLSGGERSRVILAKILKRGGNVLVLDEPTNDLDLATLRLLEEALVAFDGVVIVVSHDRYFLNRVCTDILAFEGDGRTFHNVGNYDYYLEKRGANKASEIASQRTSEAGAPSAPKKSSRPDAPRKLKWKEAQELEGMEAAILAAEDEVARLEAVFADPNSYATHGAQWKELDEQLQASRHNVAGLYARWEELEKIRQATPT